MSAAPVRHRSTYQATPATVAEQQTWYIADLEGKTLGRAATKIASVLRGKHRAIHRLLAAVGNLIHCHRAADQGEDEGQSDQREADREQPGKRSRIQKPDHVRLQSKRRRDLAGRCFVDR